MIIKLEYGANPNSINSNDNTPLIIASMLIRPEKASLLINYGADVNITNSNGNTALTYAVQFRDTQTTKLLLDNGAFTEIADIAGKSTPLMNATINGNTENVKLLLQHGADVNKVDNIGETALMKALKYKRRDIAELLRNAGAKR